MKISMSILRWQLEDLHPKCHIIEDELCIQKMRFLYYEQDPVESEYLYIALLDGDDQKGGTSGSYILLNRKSYMIFEEININEFMNRLLVVFDLFNNWERKLLELKAEKAPVSEFLSSSIQLFGNPMAVSDPNFYVIGHIEDESSDLDPVWKNMTEYNSENGPLDDPILDVMTGEPIQEYTPQPWLAKNVYAGGAPVVMMYIRREGEMVGIFTVLTANASMREINMQMAPFFVKFLVSARELIEVVKVRPSAHLLENLLDGGLPSVEIESVVRSYMNPPWRLLCVVNPNRNDQLSKRSLAARAAKYHRRCMAVVREDSVMLMISDKDYDEALSAFSSLVNSDQMSISVSMPFSDLTAIQNISRQITYIRGFQKEKNGICSFENYVIDYCVSDLKKDPMASLLVHPAFSKLEEYDKTNGTELLKTLQVYVSSGLSSLKTAEELYLHPNSMKYRLKRIRELTGLTLMDGYELDWLRLSVWLLIYG